MIRFYIGYKCDNSLNHISDKIQSPFHDIYALLMFTSKLTPTMYL